MHPKHSYRKFVLSKEIVLSLFAMIGVSAQTVFADDRPPGQPGGTQGATPRAAPAAAAPAAAHPEPKLESAIRQSPVGASSAAGIQRTSRTSVKGLADKNGLVSRDDFLQLMGLKFDAVDKTRTGKLSVDEIREVLKGE